MKIFALVLLVIAAPIVLFLGWFRRPSWTWMGIWMVIGSLLCVIMYIQGSRAPVMDWGYTMGLFWLWLAFFVTGGLIQMMRLLNRPPA